MQQTRPPAWRKAPMVQMAAMLDEPLQARGLSGRAEAKACIAARLDALGRPADLLTDEAVDALIAFAGGSMRRLRAALASTLFLGATEEAPRIDRSHVARAIDSLPQDAVSSAPALASERRHGMRVASALAFAGVTLVAIMVPAVTWQVPRFDVAISDVAALWQSLHGLDGVRPALVETGTRNLPPLGRDPGRRSGSAVTLASPAGVPADGRSSGVAATGGRGAVRQTPVDASAGLASAGVAASGGQLAGGKLAAIQAPIVQTPTAQAGPVKATTPAAVMPGSSTPSQVGAGQPALPPMPAPIAIGNLPLPPSAMPLDPPGSAARAAEQAKLAARPLVLPTLAPTTIVLRFVSTDPAAIGKLASLTEKLHRAGYSRVFAYPRSGRLPSSAIYYFFGEDREVAQAVGAIIGEGTLATTTHWRESQPHLSVQAEFRPHPPGSIDVIVP